MRRLLGLKDSSNTHSSDAKGKERQRDSTSASVSLPDPPSFRAPMEVHVSTEVHSAADRQGFHPLASTASIESSSSASSGSRPLPPEIRVPAHPYPYWQGCTHTPSSSSQSSLESPATPSHVSWLGLTNTSGNPSSISNGSRTNLNLIPASVSQPSSGPWSSSHSLVQGRSSPNPNFPPPPSTNPPPNISIRPKLLHPTKSSHSLRVPVQEYFNQQLSPIVEQDYVSPERRPSSLPSSAYEGAGTRSSTAHTVRTSAAMLTPVSSGNDGFGTATVTPVSPVPITPVLVSARGALPASQTQAQTPVTPSYPGGVVPFARRKEEEGSDSPRPSPVSTFILRPLNRSISLSSTRTHQSSVSSVTPPVIPPLDLKPEFRGQAFLTTPTSLHSRGLLEVPSPRDDDSVSDRRESFVTARTGPGRESRYSLGQDEVFVDAEEGFRRDSSGTVYPFDTHLLDDTTDTPPTPQSQPIPQDTSKPVKPPIPARTIIHPRSTSNSSSLPPSYNHPSGSHSSDNPPLHIPHPHPHPHPHRSTSPPIVHAPRLGLSAPSLQELGTSTSASSSFIDRRFAASSLYLAPASERETVRQTGSRWTLRPGHVDTVKVLFWLGFIMPWCWLFGGWLVSPKPPPPSRGHAGLESGHGSKGNVHKSLDGGRAPSLLPLLGSKNKSVRSLDTTKVYHGYPFVAPSVLSLTPPPPPYPSQSRNQSRRTVVVLTPKPIPLGGHRMRNPYVRRCRIAAAVSGVLLVVAFLVALVVVGTRHGA